MRKLSDTFKVRDEISDVHEALENLWVALGGIDASGEDRRLSGEQDGVGSETED